MTRIKEKNRFNNIGDFDKAGYKSGLSLRRGWTSRSEIYRKISDELNINAETIITPRQIHSTEIRIIDDDYTNEEIIADGVISKRNGLCLTVSTADCIPIIFIDESSGYFGAVHVGWRGYTAGIIYELQKLINELNIDAGKIKVNIGPSIKVCCFEVGPEVAVLFNEEYILIRNNKFYVNLTSAVSDSLLKIEIDKSNLNESRDCTCCGSDKYYSFRKDGNSMIQMVSYIYKK
jgi:YfiH family protein